MTLLVNQFRNEEAVQNRENVNLDATADAKRVVLFDSSGNEIGLGLGSGSSIVSGTKTVTTAGTAVQVSASPVPCKGVWVCCDLIVGVVVVVGDSAVVGNASGMKGVILTPGNPPIFLAVTNLNLLWVDAQANGGKLSYLYVV